MIKLTPRRYRWLLGLYPPYLGAGIFIRHVASDWSTVTVSMRLNRLNKNYVGTQFGGSLASMTDAHLMFMLLERLGRDYLVWDQAMSIRYVKPGKTAVHVTFTVTEAELDAIRLATADGAKHTPTWSVQVVDDHGELVAEVDRTLYIRKKRRVR